MGAARRGLGPSVIEALTYRHGGHNVGQNLKEDELGDEVRYLVITPAIVRRTSWGRGK